MHASPLLLIAVCTVLCLMGRCTAQNDRLQLLWRDSSAFPLGFEEKSGQIATTQGTPVLQTTSNGPPGLSSALRLSGGESLRLAQPLPALYSSSLTVLMWLDRVGTGARALISHATADGLRGWQMYFSGNNVRVNIGSGNASLTYSLGVPQAWSNWATISVAISPTAITLSDTSCATSTVSLLAPLVPPPDPTPVLLGDDLIGSSLLWDGFFGPVLIFDTVLSSAQLSAVCNDFNATQELAKPPSPSQTPSQTPSNSRTPSQTPSNSPTPSETATQTPTASRTPTPSTSPSVTSTPSSTTLSTPRPTQRAIGPLVTEVVTPVDGGELTLELGGDLPDFLITFGLREVTPSGETVVDISASEMPDPDQFAFRDVRLPNFYRLQSGPIERAPPARIDQQAEFFVTATDVAFGDRVVQIPDLAYKFVISIFDWPFQSVENELWLIISTRSSSAEQCESELNDEEEESRLTLVFSDGTLFSANFFRFGLKDGDEKLISLTNTLIAPDRVAIRVPFFNSSIILDPSFQVLVEGEYAREETQCSNSGKNNNKLLPLTIALPIAVVCCLCCLIPVVLIALLLLAKFGGFQTVFLAGDEMEGSSGRRDLESRGSSSPTD